MQHQGIVLELAEPAVAVEAEQRSDGTGLVIMIDMDRGSCLADGAESLLLLQQVIRFGRRDAISSSEVVAARSADLLRDARLRALWQGLQ